MLLPFCFFLALLVGCALVGSDLVKGVPLRFHGEHGSSGKAWRERRARRCS